LETAWKKRAIADGGRNVRLKISFTEHSNRFAEASLLLSNKAEMRKRITERYREADKDFV
jgi:hypothetical protein